MTTAAVGVEPRRRPRPVEVFVLLAFVWGEALLWLLPPSPPPTDFLESAFSQAFFALVLLDAPLSGRSWRSVGLGGEGLLPSLALGALLTAVIVGLNLAAISLGLAEHGTIIGGAPGEALGVPLAFGLYVAFWGVAESVWMAYLVFTVNRWLTGTYVLTWRALLLASLWFGLVHVFTQIVWAGASLPEALPSVFVGAALFVPGIIPKLTGNAWGLVLWFTATNFGL